jgi:hypothetical protein
MSFLSLIELPNHLPYEVLDRSQRVPVRFSVSVAKHMAWATPAGNSAGNSDQVAGCVARNVALVSRPAVQESSVQSPADVAR